MLEICFDLDFSLTFDRDVDVVIKPNTFRLIYIIKKTRYYRDRLKFCSHCILYNHE